MAAAERAFHTQHTASKEELCKHESQLQSGSRFSREY